MFLLFSCSSVESKKIAEKSYLLTQYSTEPPISLDTMSLKDKAWEVCPIGFDVITKNAYKKGELGLHHDQCVMENCDFALQWKVVCTIKPKESFSIFGPN